METLTAGATVQYRRVGIAVLVAPVTGLDLAADGSGWWHLEWVKAPKKYRDEDGTQSYFIQAKDLVK